MKTDPVIEKALERGQSALSERDSKLLLEKYQVPVIAEMLVGDPGEAAGAAHELGYPVVLKACGPDLTHKTERDLVAVGLRTEDEVRRSFEEIAARVADEPYEGILVQRMVSGKRELVIGLIRDDQFGPCVMFGLGGIFTEILKDTSFRVAPITRSDAMQMMEDIRARDILGPVRGMAPADRERLADALVGLGNLGMEQEAVAEVDVNPLIISDQGVPLAVDALVVLRSPQG